MEYVQLPLNDDEKSESPHSNSSLLEHTPDDGNAGSAYDRNPSIERQSKWLTLASIIAIVITAINLAVVNLSPQYHHWRSQHHALARPNAYIGLERLQRNESSPGYPLHRSTYPDFMGVVNSQGDLQSPNNFSVVLDNEHSLIISIEPRDFGMESCALGLWVPDQEQHEHRRKSYSISGTNQTLLVWKSGVESNSALTKKPISWSTKRRQDFIGTVEFTPSTRTFTSFFHCPARTMQTVEVACASADCRIEFVQDRIAPLLGFWLRQSETTTN